MFRRVEWKTFVKQTFHVFMEYRFHYGFIQIKCVCCTSVYATLALFPGGGGGGEEVSILASQVYKSILVVCRSGDIPP